MEDAKKTIKRIPFFATLQSLPFSNEVQRSNVYEGRCFVMTQLFASDPNVLDGSPLFAGTEVPVQSLFDYLAEGESINTYLLDHPSVTREQVEAALDEREVN
jgi:uncharacterized protein (DUF433 family)